MYFLYFDPGLGAMIIQGILAAVAGVLLFSKNVWYKIKLFFGITKKDDELFDDIDIKEANEEQEEND